MGWEVAERKSFKVADLASPGSLLERVFVSSQLLSPGVADPLGKWFERATAVTEWHSEAAIDAHSVRKSDDYEPSFMSYAPLSFYARVKSLFQRSRPWVHRTSPVLLLGRNL